MPLIVFHTKRVREALAKPAALGIELFFLFLVGSIIGAAIAIGRQVSAPLAEKVEIDLSISSLPKYVILSLMRGFLAYGLSLAFTLVYGTIAAHNRRAEKLMLPALDVLQAIPVLGFLPTLVIAMIALFPTRELGLEIACIIMIFTGQAWNMTFSFHGSLRSIPQPLREVAAVQGLGGWKTFKLLEVPAAMIGLVWNSMMSMAGGWFFLTVNEAFTLGKRDYRLPGIGSYMNEALNQFEPSVLQTWAPVVAAVVAMTLMIIVVDQLFWRPIVVWSQRFKLEETTETDKPQSWVLDLLQRSRLYNWIVARLGARRRKVESAPAAAADAAATAADPAGRPVRPSSAPSDGRRIAMAGLKWLLLAAMAVIAVTGAWSMIGLLISLPFNKKDAPHDWLGVFMALGASFCRTSAAVLLGAAWALPVGVLIGRSPAWSKRLQPVVQVLASFPAPMLFPLVTALLLWLQVPFTIGCVALMLLGAQWYILFNVIAGASAIPADLKEVATVYRMSRWQRWTRLYLPCVFPYLVTGLITAAGGAWNATIVSEYIQIKQQTHAAFGLGSMISEATASADYPLLCAAVVTMATFVVLVNRFFWKRLYRLAEERYSIVGTT